MEIRRSKAKSTSKSFFLSKLFRRRQAEVSRSRRHLRFEVFEPRHLLAAAPLALADHYSVTENAALDVLAKGVLANDTDADGDALTARLVAGPSHGALTLRNDGSFLYTPTTGYVGSDQFTYRANDGVLDSAITAVAIDVTNGPALQTGVATGITNQGWTRVTLDHGYHSMVVVATPSYQIGGTPLIARIRNATGNSFEVRVDRADGSTAAVAATDVRYTVVEEGVYTLAQHGVKMEAVKFTSTQTDFAGSWVGQQRSYANAYSNPVVVGQVMTANDADPSVFWARGAAAGDAPSASQLFVGKHVGEHRDMTRANEVIGYIVIESGSGKVGNFAYVAGVGAETVQGPDNGPAATYGISGLVAVSSAVVSPAGMNGLDGGWTVLAGSNSVSTSGLQLFFEEDRWNDTERAHIAEQAAYLVFGEASAPHLRSGTVENVSSTEWTTVTLDRAYRSMVVVVTPDYAAGSDPIVTRVRNATGSSFQVLVQRADASTAPVTGIRVHYTVVEEGVYNVAQHGVKMEAFKFSSSQTDSARSWVGQQRAYANSYANPVVLGQVMSTNDPRMSVFWSRGASRVHAPTSDTLFVGKHVGEDRITMRAAEVIGYMVLETGAGSVSGLDYVAGVGASTVVGPDNGPPGLYPINGPAGAAVAIASAAGANGLDGGWAVLAGNGSISNTGLRLFIEEDNLADPERVHTTERVAYVVFAASGAPTITSTPVTSATEELAYSYDVQATDPEPGDTLTYSLLTAPAGMTINASSGLISWTPTNAQVGTQSVTVRVQDTDLAQATQSFTITVANTNDPPSITSTPVTSATEDLLYSYDVNASDPDVGDTLTYSLTTAPTGMTINASTGVISWTPTNVQVGSHSVTVRVQDAALAQATQSFTVSVLNANDPPTITSTPVTAATEDAAYSYDVNATDPDVGDTLTYSLTTAPIGMTINASSGVISWTPTNAQVGANSVTVRVQDTGLAAATQSFTVTVSNTNDAPDITSTPVTSATALLRYNYDVEATDPDVGDTLTYSLTVAPAGMTINASTGLISWTPTAGQVGSHTVTVRVQDAATSYDTQSFSVEVADASQAVPHVRTGQLLNVGNTAWTKVTLDRAYSSMVVVTTPSYAAGNPPVVTRVRNAVGDSFEVQVQRLDGSTAALSGITVYYTVVEEGVYTQAMHGVTMEAVKYNSTVTDSDSSWVGEARGYHNSYSAPVVLGQVMTSNDTRFSVFWSRGASRTEIPTANSLYVGKHVGEDPVVTRATEVVGYIVIESGAGAIGSLSYVAGVGAGTVVGPDNSPPVTYATNGPADATVAVLSASGAVGLDGGWAVLAGANSVTSSALRLFIEEDNLLDAERLHVAERVAYLMFPPTNGPKITSDPVTAATEDAAYSYDVNAVDPDAGDTLTYSLVSGPSGMTIQSATGLISWTPTNSQVGANMVTVLVSDSNSATATQTFKITVANTNDRPIITSTPVTTATEDAAYSYDVNATDPDVGDTLTYSLGTAPTGMTINSTTGVISWTPTNAQVGLNSVMVRVRDAALAEATQSFTIAVANTNDAPTITSTPVTTATEDSAYSYDVNATDPDLGDTLTYALTTAPTGMTINTSTGMISWTPTNAQVGSHSVTVRVRDVALAQATQTFTVTVANVNDAPTITSTPITTATEDSAYSYDVNATDVDAGDTLTYALTTAPTGMTINATTGMISWTPTNAQVGAISVTVRVRDAASAEATQTFTVTVANTNDAPTITSTPVTTGSVGAGYTYDVNATDPDAGDTLTYALTTAPTGMTINASTGVISWTPTLAQVGSQSVTVRVRDVALAQATQTFSVTVTDSNHAPVANNDNYSATEATTLTVAAAGVLANDTDSDSDPLTAVLVAGPSHGTLTLNANGSFTYTPTTGFTGTDSFTYKASDGEANSNVATVNLMVNPVNTVLITAAWLAAQGAGPYLLTQANTNYVLQTDVTVDGTAFVVGEANITLDLNGHSVTYGNAAPVVVNNGGFEVGSGRNVPGWDLSAAPSASIAPNAMYMWGDQVLTLSNFTGTQTLVSDPIALTQAGHEYAATVTPIGPGDATVKLSVVDATTQQVLASANSAAVNRGFAAVVKFVPASSTTVVLKVEVTAASGKTQSVSLDYASLTPSRDFGISTTPSPWYWPDQLKNNSAAYSAASKAKAFTVRNGMIVQGQSKSYTGNAIHAQSLNGLTVRDVEIRVNGIDTAAIYGQWISGAAIIDGNTIQSTVEKVTNRMHIGAMLSFNSVTGTFSITNNTIKDHPKTGIELSGGQGHVISHNTIDSNANVTNCYGILVMGIQHSTIHHNTIVTERSGRGILVDALTSDAQDTVDLEIFENTVDVRERANLEFGSAGIEATALRLRSYRDAGHRNLNIHNNTFIARTGVGGSHGAIGVRVSYMNNDSAVEWSNVVSNNVFKAIVDTTDPYYWARAIAIEGVVSGTGLKFFENAIESNDISLGLSGNDGFYAHDVTFTSSTFVKSTEGASRTYQAVRAGDNNGDVDTVYLIDSRYEGGASEDVTFVGTGAKEVLIGWSLDVVVRNSSGSLLAGALVEVRDKDLSVVWSGSTSASGSIQDIPVVTKCLRQSASAAVTVDSRGPHRVRVSLNGYDTKDVQVSLDSSTTLDVTLL